MGKLRLMATLLSLGLLTQSCCFAVEPNAQEAPPVEQQVEQTLINSLDITKPKTAREWLTPSAIKALDDYGSTRLKQQCDRQPLVPWCTYGDRQKQTRVLTPREIKNSSQGTYTHFTYIVDKVDSWNSFSSFALEGKRWYGDCDDLTSTTLDIMHRDGQPLSAMWMLLVNVRGPGILDHVVGVVQDDNGDYWVVGDTSSTRNVYPLSELTHRPMSIVRMDGIADWIPVTESPVFKDHQGLLDGKYQSRSLPRR